jgi:hypothetical protein
VNRADCPVRTLSDQVGERIAAAIAGQPADGYSISTPLDRADLAARRRPSPDQTKKKKQNAA